MAEHAAAPRARLAKAHLQKPAYAERAELEQVRAALDDCRHALDLQFQRMAQMQGEIDRLKADVQRTAVPASHGSSETPSE